MRLAPIIIPTAALATSLSSPYISSETNLVENGSFECPAIPMGFSILPNISGWTMVSFGSFELWNNLNGWPSDEGQQHLEADNSIIEQALATIPGKSYEVSVAYSPRPGVPSNRILIEWEEQEVGDITLSGAGLPSLAWSTFQTTVQATTSSAVLRISGLGTNPLVGMLVDDVAVCEVLPPAPLVYCIGKTSSAGCNAAISTTDLALPPSSGVGNYFVTASNVQEIKIGLLFGGISGPASAPFNGGTLCVLPPIKRGLTMTSGGDNPNECAGAFATLVNDGQIIPGGLDAGSGNTAWYQYWYRDPMNGEGQLGTALSDALQIHFQ